MFTEYDAKTSELIIKIKLGKPTMTRHNKDSADRNNVPVGTPKNYLHANSRGFQTIDVEHEGYPMKVSYNVISEIPPKVVKKLIKEEELDE